jgi:hypothetical protein
MVTCIKVTFILLLIIPSLLSLNYIKHANNKVAACCVFLFVFLHGILTTYQIWNDLL